MDSPLPNRILDQDCGKMELFFNKKLNLGWGLPLWYRGRKKTYSHKSRKSPPARTQRHRSPCETRMALDMCFGIGYPLE